MSESAGERLERSCGASAADRIRIATSCRAFERIEAIFAGHGFNPHRHDTSAIDFALRVDAGNIGTDDRVLSRAADEGADLLVMGVNSRTRLRELVLGGVSRHLFDHMPIPVFMAR